MVHGKSLGQFSIWAVRYGTRQEIRAIWYMAGVPDRTVYEKSGTVHGREFLTIKYTWQEFRTVWYMGGTVQYKAAIQASTVHDRSSGQDGLCAERYGTWSGVQDSTVYGLDSMVYGQEFRTVRCIVRTVR